jgi:hypothetical protein
MNGMMMYVQNMWSYFTQNQLKANLFIFFLYWQSTSLYRFYTLGYSFVLSFFILRKQFF